MKKRILFIVPFLSSGGAEKVVSIWASELAKLGVDVHLLLFYRVEKEYSLNKLVKVHTISNKQEEYNKLLIPQKIQLIRKNLKHIRPNIVLPFLTHVGIMTNIARIGLDICLVETIRINPEYSPSNLMLRTLRNISVSIADKLIVQNYDQQKYFPKYIQDKSTVFSNPISDEFTKDSKSEFNKIKTIVAVGRLEPQKNYHMLINAFSKIEDKDIKLYIYGEGSLEQELRKLIKQLDLANRVVLYGRTNNIKKALLAADLYILSSDAEGMPNSLMEAMATGLPCISTDCPTGPADLIKHEENGLLIPVNDEKALLNSINFMINSPKEAVRMGEEARKKILNEYTAEISARKLIQYFEKI